MKKYIVMAIDRRGCGLPHRGVSLDFRRSPPIVSMARKEERIDKFDKPQDVDKIISMIYEEFNKNLGLSYNYNQLIKYTLTRQEIDEDG